jgi:16S rRNA (cytosine1402-N4)-methyltransferase
MQSPFVGGDLPHQPVLFNEIIHALQPHGMGLYVDGTVGAGGHAWGILSNSEPDGLLLGLDVDPQALILARRHLEPFGQRVKLIRASYTTLRQQVDACGWKRVDGILLDLGASTMQYSTQERGFSFLADAPLDMRFDPQNPITAYDLVNGLSEADLADVIYNYGEERNAYRVARAIIGARPIKTTQQLAKVVARVTFSGKSGMHPATRTFQALRIAVNHELEAIKIVLPQAVDLLAKGGRLAVIAFHSLEDRIVKQFFRRESRDCICPPKQPVCTCGHMASITELFRSPIRPQENEVSQNPRARSARLRVAVHL